MEGLQKTQAKDFLKSYFKDNWHIHSFEVSNDGNLHPKITNGTEFKSAIIHVNRELYTTGSKKFRPDIFTDINGAGFTPTELENYVHGLYLDFLSTHEDISKNPLSHPNIPLSDEGMEMIREHFKEKAERLSFEIQKNVDLFSRSSGEIEWSRTPSWIDIKGKGIDLFLSKTDSEAIMDNASILCAERPELAFEQAIIHLSFSEHLEQSTSSRLEF